MSGVFKLLICVVPISSPYSHALKHFSVGVEREDSGTAHPRAVQQPQSEAFHEG